LLEFSNQYISHCAIANLKLVDKLCYLDDMLSVHGYADAAEKATIRIRWDKFKKLLQLLTSMDMSLIVRLYSSCVQSSVLHGSETWPVRKENEVALQRAEI